MSEIDFKKMDATTRLLGDLNPMTDIQSMVNEACQRMNAELPEGEKVKIESVAMRSFFISFFDLIWEHLGKPDFEIIFNMRSLENSGLRDQFAEEALTEAQKTLNSFVGNYQKSP